MIMECPHDEPATPRYRASLLALAMRRGHRYSCRTPGAAAGRSSDRPAGGRDRLGVSTAALAPAARQRGIPVRRAGGLSLLRLGYGATAGCCGPRSPSRPRPSAWTSPSDKVLAKELLAARGRTGARRGAWPGRRRKRPGRWTGWRARWWSSPQRQPRRERHVGVATAAAAAERLPAGGARRRRARSWRNMSLAPTTGSSWWTGGWWPRPGCTRPR